jgi:hypothetical protein
MQTEREIYKEKILEVSKQQKLNQKSLLNSGSVSGKKDLLEQIPYICNEKDLDPILDFIKDKNGDIAQRQLALHKIEILVSKKTSLIDELIHILTDEDDHPLIRMSALNLLRQSTLRAAIFNPKKAEYLKALRTVVRDENPELRVQAMEALAGEKDEYLQRLLSEGLQAPEKALVPPEKAIQLLGYDLHFNLYPLLRNIVRNPPNGESRMEALRLLGGDPQSTELLSQVMENKLEDIEARVTATVAIQTLDPVKFNSLARNKVMDEDEDDDIRAICLNALAQNTDVEKLKQDKELIDFLQRKASGAGPNSMRATAFTSSNEQDTADELGKASSMFLLNLEKEE